jgi:phosphatidate phosphatase APP1
VPVHPVPPEGLSVISDIDDTIRITEVRNTKRMITNMLMAEVRPVPGMAELYHEWAHSRGAQFHYLSASPYQIFPSLRLFLREQYPPGSVHMRHITERGVKAVLSLLSTPKTYKPEAISQLIEALPGRTFVLVGDSGEHDPEVYAEMARKYPTQVRRILIRNVSCEDAGAERYQIAFAGLPPELWRIFSEPAEIRTAIDDVARPAS